MRPRLGLYALTGGLFLVFIFFSFARADLQRYTYPYDISQIEWQLLNWTAAWRGSTTLANPFILENMEYDRKANRVHIYLSGKVEEASDENLEKSINTIISRFQERFPKFEAKEDLVVHYNLKSEKNETSYREYSDGAFGTGTT